MDGPDLGGFISSTTIVKASLWRMGQLKSGDTIQYRRISLKDALHLRAKTDKFLESVSALVAGQCDPDTIEPISDSALPDSTISGNWGKALVYRTELGESGVDMTFRQVRDGPGYHSYWFLITVGRVGMNSCWSSLVKGNSISTIAAELRRWSRLSTSPKSHPKF